MKSLRARAKKRAEFLPPLPRVKLAAAKAAAAEMRAILAEDEADLCGVIASVIDTDCTTTRIYLTSFRNRLGAFLKRPQRTYAAIDVLREWMRERFGERIRVEGDPNSIGFFLELA